MMNCCNWFGTVRACFNNVNLCCINNRQIHSDEENLKEVISTERTESNEKINFGKELDSLDYNMEHQNRGNCLIFNHFEFDHNPSRHGTHVDCNKLETNFGRLGFKVSRNDDKTADQIEKIAAQVSSRDFSESDCLVCCILTHGCEDGYVHARDGIYSLSPLMNLFSPNNCPTLEGKPKIFIIQSCRGTKHDKGVDIRVETDSLSNQMSNLSVPPHPDFLVIYASMPGFYSFRDTLSGSWLIQTLTQLIMDKRDEDIDFLSLLTMVNLNIANDKISHSDDLKHDKKKQTLNISHTLTKRIFFRAKPVQTNV